MSNLVGYPVQFVVGENDKNYEQKGTVLGGQVVAVHEDGNLSVLVHFKQGSAIRNHVPVEGTKTTRINDAGEEVDAPLNVSYWRHLGPLEEE